MGHIAKINVWKCDNCGKEEQWGPNWRSKMILHKTWDEVIVVCSERCAKDIDGKHNAKRSHKIIL